MNIFLQNYKNRHIGATMSICVVLFVFCTCLLPSPSVRGLLTNFVYAEDSEARTKADQIWTMDSCIGLKRAQLVKACQFIERLKNKRLTTNKIFDSKRTGLPCVIEKLKKSKGFLIRNLPGNMIIGHGVHKVVKKAIYYGSEPKIAAHCLTDKTGKSEIKILNQLHSAQGIVRLLGDSSAGKGRYSIYLEYFSGGTLNRLMKKKHQFNEEQILKIAKDLVAGLQAMHKRNLIHRDLHFGNILLKKDDNGEYKAVLVDFGKTMNAKRAGNLDVPQAPQSRNPPEALITPFSKMDRFRVDVYALGCNFYGLIWGKLVPWSYSFNVRTLSKFSYTFRKNLYDKISKQYEKLRMKNIGKLIRKLERGEELSPFEHFEILVMNMVNCNVRERPSLKYVAGQLDRMQGIGK